ncbi:MAG: hypothetical protein P8I62_06260 [Pseudomonadales bacterium]|nr:hypothetical protein [Pseudomonadales bacterium]
MKLKEYPKSFFRARELKRKSLESLACKVNEVEHSIPVIISLTSIPERLKYIHLTIRSLLCQDYTALKIVLWLNEELRGQLPKSLTELEHDRFEIIFNDHFSSHRKLVYSLDRYKESLIVTCDDDLMYDVTWLGRLMFDHKRFPSAVIAHECREITFGVDQKLLPYRRWSTIKAKDYSHVNLLPIGYGGVLYPAGALYADVTNRDLYMELAPKADDLWFKAMSFLKGTPVRRSSNPGEKPMPIIGAKGSSLAKENVFQDGNRIQWQAICNHYQIKLKNSDELKARDI